MSLYNGTSAYIRKFSKCDFIFVFSDSLDIKKSVGLTDNKTPKNENSYFVRKF